MFSKNRKNLQAVLWLLLTTILLCLPGKSLPDTDGDWFSRIYADKWVHVFLFTVLVFLFCRTTSVNAPYKKWLSTSRLKMAGWGVLYGTAMELVQLWLISGRGFEFFDILADAAGCIIGYLISVYRVRKK